MLNILTIIGTRPQIIKSNILSCELKKNKNIKETIVDTGQHYDYEMSKIFYEEFGIIEPDINLNIRHSNQTTQISIMIQKIDQVIQELTPDYIIVYGDTNSTFCAALAASINKTKICHIESGLRSFNKNMQEERNRIVTDHLSEYLFVPTNNAKLNLIKEGFKARKIKNYGDLLLDASKKYSNKICSELFLKKYNLNKNKFILLTIHRQENINKDTLNEILESILKLSKKIKIIFPIHPRTKRLMQVLNIKFIENINFKMISPLGYIDTLCAIKNSKMIITDSGGVQREAYFLKRFSIIIRKETEWIEILKQKSSVLVRPKDICMAYEKFFDHKIKNKNIIFGDGKAAKKIANFMESLS